MIAVLQRVKRATVIANGEFSGSINNGLYILLGVEKDDSINDAKLLAEKIVKLRIFSDENGKMNLSIMDIDGEALIVSNFTLSANYAHGNRPDYMAAANPELASELYNYFVTLIKENVRKCQTGRFGADMESEMVTDGPVTIIMHSKVLQKKGKS